MSKLMILGSALLALSLTACGPNPAGSGTTTGNGTTTGTGTTPGTGTATGGTSIAAVISTKASYIAFLNCVKEKHTKPEDKASVEAAIANLNNVPDSTWAIFSATLSASVQASYGAQLAACGSVK